MALLEALDVQSFPSKELRRRETLLLFRSLHSFTFRNYDSVACTFSYLVPLLLTIKFGGFFFFLSSVSQSRDSDHMLSRVTEDSLRIPALLTLQPDLGLGYGEGTVYC